MVHAAYWLFLGVLIGAPLLLGGVPLWSKMLIESASLLALLLAWQAFSRKGLLLKVPGFVPGCLLLGWILLQLIPLPAPLISMLSPQAQATYMSLPWLGTAWLPLTLKPYLTLQEFLRFVTFFSIYILTIQFLAKRDYLRQAVTLSLLCGGLVAFQAILQYFVDNGKMYWMIDPGSEEYFGGFNYRNHFAGFMEMLLPLAMVLFFYYRPRDTMELGLRQKIVHFVDHLQHSPAFRYGFISLLLFSAILLSQSRTGVSVVVACCTLMIFAQRRLFQLKRTSPVLLLLFLVLAGVIVGSSGLDKIDQRFGAVLSDNPATPQENSLASRVDFWRDSLGIMHDFPLTGSGFGTFYAVFPGYKSYQSQMPVRQAHNDYIELATDGGLVALLLAGLCLGSILWANFKQYRKRKEKYVKHLYVGTLTGIIALLLHCLVEYQFRQNTAVPLYFFFLLGVQTVAIHSRRSVERTPLLAQMHVSSVGRWSVSLSLLAIIGLGLAFRGGEVIAAAGAPLPSEDPRERVVLSPEQRQETTQAFYQRMVRNARFAPLNPVYVVAAAYSAQLSGEAKDAEHYFQVALQLDPMNADALQLYGQFLSGLPERTAEADTLLHLSVQRDKNVAERQLFYVLWLLGQGEQEDGLQEAKVFLSQYPEHSIALYTILDQSPMPSALLKECLPDRFRPYLAYAQFLAQKGETEKAAEAYSTSLGFIEDGEAFLRSDFLEPYEFFKRNNYRKQMVSVLKSAVVHSPNDSLFHVYLGDSYVKEGLLHQASEEYLVAKQLNPGSRTVQKRISTLNAKIGQL